MQRLNLPTYSFKLKSEDGRKLIFDPLRRKYVALTPEEWVRQNFIQYLVRERSFPGNLIVIEKQFTYNRLTKRADILVYNRSGIPVLIVECKSPQIPINQDTFNQAALYNLRFNVPYLAMTNGLKHYCCRFNKGDSQYVFLEQIPDFRNLISQDG